MGAYPKGTKATIFLETNLYDHVYTRVRVRNIGIGNLRFKQEEDGTYAFSGTIHDDYGPARILGGKMDATHATFRLVYNTGIDEELAEEIDFNLENSIYGGWSGNFTYTSPKSNEATTGNAICAIIAT